MSAVPAAAPPRTTATRPFGAIDPPAPGDRTAPTAGSRRSRPATRPVVARKAGLALSCVRELTTATSA